MLAGRPEGAGPGTGAVTFSTHWSRMVSTAFRLISTNRAALRPEGGVVTAEGLKALYETELRYEIGSLGLASEERQGLWHLFSASRRMRPGELREQDHPGVWLWSDLHLGHAMTISVFGRPYSTPVEMGRRPVRGMAARRGPRRHGGDSGRCRDRRPLRPSAEALPGGAG